MAYSGNYITNLPEWNPDAGTYAEPPSSIINDGFDPGDVLPAQWINYFWKYNYESLKELDTAIQNLDDSFSENLEDLTDAEVSQLKNIDANTITNTQWGYLGELDQSLTTTSDVEFNSVDTTTITNLNTINGIAISDTQWTYISNMNQNVNTTADVEFNSVDTTTITNLNTINGIAISDTQWTYVSNLDQSLTTSSSVEFSGIANGTSNLGYDDTGGLSFDSSNNANFSNDVNIEGDLFLGDTQVGAEVIEYTYIFSESDSSGWNNTGTDISSRSFIEKGQKLEKTGSGRINSTLNKNIITTYIRMSELVFPTSAAGEGEEEFYFVAMDDYSDNAYGFKIKFDYTDSPLLETAVILPISITGGTEYNPESYIQSISQGDTLELKIVADINGAGSIKYYIDGTLIATETTNLPNLNTGYALYEISDNSTDFDLKIDVFWFNGKYYK